MLVQARCEARQAQDRRVEAWAVWGLSDIGVARGDWDLAARSAEESLAMFQALDDPSGIGWSLFMTATGQARLGWGTATWLAAGSRRARASSRRSAT